jgi:hypothetical protein
LHGRNKKNPGAAGAFNAFLFFSVITTGENGDQVKEVNEEVKDIQVKAYGGANIVRLSAMNDSAGIKQNQSCHDHHDYR